MFYSLNHILNEVIPVRAHSIYKRFRKYYMGERDDLIQSASLYVIEWANKFDNKEKLPEEFIEVMEKGFVKEIQANKREHIDREYSNLFKEVEESEEFIHFRNKIRRQVELLFSEMKYTKKQRDLLYKHLILEETPEELLEWANKKHSVQQDLDNIKQLIWEAKKFLEARLSSDLSAPKY